MGKTSRKRKFFILFGLLLSLVVIALVALPLWFPWILPSVAKKYGLSYSRYERDGYSRFILHEAKFSRQNAKFEAEQLEVLFPTTFLWRNFKDDFSENYLRISGWTLEIAQAKEKKAGTNSVFDASEKFDSVMAELNRWLPKAALDKGTIRFQDKEIKIPAAEWDNGNLLGQVSAEKLFPETFFNAHLGNKTSKEILLENPTWNFGGELSFVRNENHSLQIQGNGLWRSNRVEVAAQFGRQGFLPEMASVKCDPFRIPSQFAKLEGYHDLTGSFDLQWKTNRFTLDLTGKARPVQNKEIFLSPISTVIHASGDTNFVRIETVAISSPWLAATLSTNVEFSFRGEMLSPNATLKIAANLAGQKWIDAAGQMYGEAILRRGTNRFPDTTFQLSGAEIDIREIEMDRLDLRGELNWPWLRIDSANVKFKEGATAQSSLKFNAVRREVSDGKIQLNGSVGHKFLPPEISYTNISLAAEFSGPVKQLSHSGHATLEGAKFPQVAPLRIVADWRARFLSFESFETKLSARDSTVAISGSANFGTNMTDVHVEKIALNKNGASILALEKPFSVAVKKSNARKFPEEISIEPLHLTGNETEISLAGKIHWPKNGNFSTSARQFSFSRIRDFLERPIPEIFIERLQTSASWTNGPMNFDFDGLTRFVVDDGSRFSAELRSVGNEKGISITSANVGTATDSIISGKGFVPVVIVPAHSNLLELLTNGRIDFHAETIPNAQLWEQLASWTRSDFRDPRVSISISGTADAPQGKITASIKEILLKPKELNQPVPHLQNLFADFDLAKDRIRLNRAEVFVEGQPVRATGELPLPKTLATDWKKIFDWRKANANLEIVDAQIAPFERLFPKLLSPLGTVNLNVRMADGKLDGEMKLADAALRPIPSLGPIHDINARMKFLGEHITLETFSGNLGGQPVDLSGEINLAKRQTNGFPDFHFKLFGTNIPLARRPDLILRSDIDLTITNENSDQPLISGALNLRDSFYLSDVKLLVPGKVAKPKQRPPYFSVEDEPFAKWRLNVDVRGTNFLKVRSPLFRGELSANLNLEGTLKEPMALGDARINSGVVQFPFANLRIDQGFISLTSDNPYRPELAVAASSRTYGYDVKMDLTGYADSPVIEFTSNPGLTSEQILLMVTAGELPRDEINFSTQQKAGRLAFFLGKNFISKFGATDARDDKLEIRSGENISEEGKQTYYLEYKLTDDWSIIGEYDRFGGLNAGFKWKFFEK